MCVIVTSCFALCQYLKRFRQIKVLQRRPFVYKNNTYFDNQYCKNALRNKNITISKVYCMLFCVALSLRQTLHEVLILFLFLYSFTIQ